MKVQKTTTKKVTPSPQTTRTSPDYFSWIVKNGIAAIVTGLLVYSLLESQQSYNWVYNGLLKGNMETIKKYPDLTLDQKFEMKLGYTYTYLNFIKNNTPQNAVILYPGSEAFFPKDVKSPFEGTPYNKIWATRFLYPRKLIIPSEVGKNHYSDKITHVAIVNGLGYDKLNYEPKERYKNCVMPIINPYK